MDEIFTAAFQALTDTAAAVFQVVAAYPAAFVALQLVAGTAAVLLGRRGR